jgi:hypothetical protein
MRRHCRDSGPRVAPMSGPGEWRARGLSPAGNGCARAGSEPMRRHKTRHDSETNDNRTALKRFRLLYYCLAEAAYY